MARIVRAIWRIDFDASYAYLNARGTALNLMTNTVDKFWDEIGDGSGNFSFSGKASRDGHFRTISLQVNAISGVLEWRAGSSMEHILQEETFRGVNKIVTELLRHCEVKAVKRVGIRLNGVEVYADGRRGGHERVANLLDGDFRSQAVATLGPLSDMAITLEGKTSDHVSYRAQFGPYDPKNVTNSLTEKPSEDELGFFKDSDLFFDIDLFESNISFAELNLFRWADTKLAKAIDFVALCNGAKIVRLEKPDGGSGQKHLKR